MHGGDGGWPAGDQADIDKVEAFLNGIDTYRARFIQTGSDGGYSEGWLWLQRPRFLRVEYAPPQRPPVGRRRQLLNLF